MDSIPAHDLIWTGSYTADSGGSGAGIGAVSSAADGTLHWLGVAAVADSPSFLAVHPSLPVVYAVAEQARTVRAYRRAGAFGLEPAGPAWPAGDAACHVAVEPSGRFLAVCCWGDGQVLFYELDADGGITARTSAAESRDPYGDAPDGHAPGRQERPSRAHAALMLADGRVMTTDLGHDLLRIWNVRSGPGPALGPVLDHEVVLPRGSGPRHLVQHPGGNVFVVAEYSIEVAVAELSPGAGDFRLGFVGPATAGGALPGDSAAEIALAAGGRHAYVGVRGSNRVSVLEVEAGGAALRPGADVPSGGNWPRHHLVRDGSLHVAHERSGDIVTFPLDADSGLPGVPSDRLHVASPTALVPARPRFSARD
ncbi:beta-propeller fold lactonase family protein [Arthrobacter sp. ok362]|uniref:lactonase family protein n=1 Tax=Arthrobacter sp. ok362 TaxID=1761745 RepID=UPI00087DFE38|nr:beta-propeller fold lactonase family protein [Arthrobacter sp. ok362]SDL44331.1 6-phosphogluconolactonase, cycloisomerase 2 family [Arthrobacter sp. ok362]